MIGGTQVSRGSIGKESTCYVTIGSNDDPCGRFVFAPGVVRAEEASGVATATIKRLGGVSGEVKVFYETMVTTDNNSSITSTG